MCITRIITEHPFINDGILVGASVVFYSLHDHMQIFLLVFLFPVYRHMSTYMTVSKTFKPISLVFRIYLCNITAKQ